MRKKAFSIIDIVFALLFVSILVLVGLKFMIAGDKQYENAKMATAFDLASSNLFEELYAYPKNDGAYETYLDSLGNAMDGAENAAYLMKYDIKEDVEGLKSISLKIMDKKTQLVMKSMEHKIYVGGRSDE